MSERTDIRPNDTILHKPTGETWVVCGVDREKGKLIPCGYPFPSLADFRKMLNCCATSTNW